MPKVDPAVGKVFLEGVDSNFVKRGYVFVNKQKNPYWWVRVDLLESKQFVRSTKIPYENNSKNQEEALEVAWSIYSQIIDRIREELDPKQTTIVSAIREYIKSAKEGYEINEQLREPVEQSIFGAFWTRQNYLLYAGFYEKVIMPFFEKPAYFSKPITDITQRDINQWMVWRTKTFKDHYSPSSLQKIDTCLRAIFEYAVVVKGERFVPPRIRSPKQNLVARRRPTIDDEKFYALQDHLRGLFQSGLGLPLRMVPLKAEQHFLFYCWIETLEHTGIRPWSSKEKAIKMSDITREKSASGEIQLYLKRNEKGKSYVAPATRYWIHTLNRLDAFYAARGLKKRKWLLCHSRDNPAMEVKKGDPIGSFKTAWNTAIRELKFNDSGLPKNKRVTPYTIRHRVITRMLVENPELSPVEIAQNVGSSLEMVSKIYYEHRVQRQYEKLQENTIDYLTNVDVYSESGGWVSIIPRNSKEHKALFKKNPALVNGVKPK